MTEIYQFKTATKLVQLGNAVTYFRNMKEEEIGLTSVQSDTMRLILDNPGITASMLRKRMKLSQSTMTGIISRLERKGIIYKSLDENDGRKFIISATPLGNELAESLKRTAVETQQVITAGMSEDEKGEFDRLLEKALDSIHSIRMRKE